MCMISSQSVSHKIQKLPSFAGSLGHRPAVPRTFSVIDDMVFPSHNPAVYLVFRLLTIFLYSLCQRMYS